MVARAGLIFTMIWDADWSSESNEPAPLSLWHCDPEYVQLKSGFSQWGNFGRSCPQGCKFYPIGVVCSYRARQPLKCGKFHISTNPLSELWVCEFWLLRWSTMVARAWPVCWGWFRIGLAACCPESNEPTLMFLWHFYPEISLWSFQWKSMGRVAKVL